MHSNNLSLITFDYDNFILNNSGKFAYWKLNTLKYGNSDTSIDIINFIKFVRKLSKIDEKIEQDACISKKFKDFFLILWNY